jgi:hypothetical protein
MKKGGNHGKSWIYPCRNGEKMENHRKSSCPWGCLYSDVGVEATETQHMKK